MSQPPESRIRRALHWLVYGPDVAVEDRPPTTFGRIVEALVWVALLVVVIKFAVPAIRIAKDAIPPRAPSNSPR